MDHVAQHWTHDLRRIQQFGTMPFEELKGLLSEEDYKKSVDEWGRQTKNKKWYHMTMVAFINFMYQVWWNLESHIPKFYFSKWMMLLVST